MNGTMVVVCALGALVQEFPQEEQVFKAIRMVDIDGDGLRDRLVQGTDGWLSVALNRGGRQFEAVVQELPRVLVSDVLVQDLDGDGYVDLYLVSPRANAALAGDGTGRFVDVTDELGLADAGNGVFAESEDLDGDGRPDVLLRNRGGDVIFWSAEGNGFERDAMTPPTVRLRAGQLEAAQGADSTAPPGGPLDVDRDADRIGFGASKSGRGAHGRFPLGAPPSIDPGVASAIELPTCATTIRDQSTDDCLFASSSPALGRLYPLSNELFIGTDGNVGLGTTNPLAPLHMQRGGEHLFVTPNSPANTVTLSTPVSHLRLDSGGDLEVSLFGTPDCMRVMTAGQERFCVQGDGDVTQTSSSNGLVKAGCLVIGASASVSTGFNLLPGSSGQITVIREQAGLYQVDFGADISGRIFQVTILGASPGFIISVFHNTVDDNRVFVRVQNSSSQMSDANFFLSAL